MDGLLTTLIPLLTGDTLSGISEQLGVDENKTQQAITMALPLLIGALNRNASTTDGAQALTGALQRDHGGSILEDLLGNLSKKETLEDGSAILGHIFGDKRGGFEQNISRTSGLDSETTVQLLSMLAPVVLGVLGQIQHKQSMEPQGVASLLQNERKSAESAVPGIAKFLDMDGDGDITEDVVSLGANLLSSFLSKK
jgi:hypothetical protein